MIIHTNAPVDHAAYMIDRNDEPVEIEAGNYKAQIKKHKDSPALVTFVTGGGFGLGTISVINDTIEGIERDLFLFEAEQSLVADLKPGAYFADILQTDDPAWIFSFTVTVDEGVTAP